MTEFEELRLWAFCRILTVLDGALVVSMMFELFAKFPGTCSSSSRNRLFLIEKGSDGFTLKHKSMLFIQRFKGEGI